MLKSVVTSEGSVRISASQSNSLNRQRNNNGYESHFLQYSELVGLVLLLREKDPEGFYFLETRPLSYEVIGASKDAREFSSLICVPSGQIEFFKASSGILSIDMAHMKGKTSGVICMPTVKDSKKHLNSIMLTIFQGEKRVSYEVLYAVLGMCPSPTVIITDKHRGMLIYFASKNNILFKPALCLFVLFSFQV